MKVKLKDICKYGNEKVDLKEISIQNYISTENLIPNFGGFVNATSLPKDGKVISYKKNDILISNIRPYFKKMIYSNTNGGCSNDVLVLKTNELVNNEFLYYRLKSDEFFNYVTLTSKGTKMPRGDKNAIMDYEFELPKLEEQIKIVNFINKFDKKIELNNKINDNLQKLIKEYYLNILEEGFNEISLAELMDYQGGSQPPASEFQYKESEENIRFVQIRDFDTDSHICYIPISHKNKLCKKDDILIARYGASLGRICYGLDGAYNVALAKVLPKDNNYKEIIRVILESKEFYEYINSVGQRSAQAGFNAGDIQAFKVKIPMDKNKVIDYNEFAKKCLNRRLLNIEENNRLIELRDTLLPKLMNGEIDLDKIEI